MAIIQSSIEAADRTQKRIFVISVIFGVIAALIAASLAWLVWNANDKYQDAVKADADARIAEAGTRAATANAEAAKANEGLSKSNAEIARLTNEAEQAKADRAEANKQIEIAKADAARAKEGIASAEARSLEASVEVAKLRVTVANAERERAEAQKALLELQQRIKDRHLTTQQKTALLQVLRSEAKGKIDLFCAAGAGSEPCNFARELAEVLRQAGWEIGKIEDGIIVGPSAYVIRVHSAQDAPPHAASLQHALKTIGLDAQGQVNPSRPVGSVQLLVNVKQ